MMGEYWFPILVWPMMEQDMMLAGEVHPRHRPPPVDWQALDAVALPTVLQEIMRRNLPNPPQVLRPGGPLYGAAIDHLAFALESREVVCDTFEELRRRPGARVIDWPRRWPEGDGCPEVPWQDRKWMATVALPKGFQVTLLAPEADGDVIATYLRKAGTAELHHVALQVLDIEPCIEEIKECCPAARQITPLAVDAGSMSQVFLKFDPDPRIVELVERSPGFEGSFTCNNVVTLTAGERQHSFPGTQAIRTK